MQLYKILLNIVSLLINYAYYAFLNCVKQIKNKRRFIFVEFDNCHKNAIIFSSSIFIINYDLVIDFILFYYFIRFKNVRRNVVFI